jgi:hypothetical protein
MASWACASRAPCWFPAWAPAHALLHCGNCITWGGLALCAAREGERRGLAARPAPIAPPREGDDKALRDALHYAISCMSAVHSAPVGGGLTWDEHRDHLRDVLHAANADAAAREAARGEG